MIALIATFPGTLDGRLSSSVRAGLRRLPLIVALASLPSGLAPEAAAAAIPAEAGPCTAGWQELPLPDAAFASVPWQVVTRGVRPAWVVGGSNTGLLALRWQDGAWRSVDSRTSGRRGIRAAIADRPASLLGVGHAREYLGGLWPISGRLGTTGWSARRTPSPKGAHAGLTDVARLAAGRARAVGTRLAQGRARPLALRWDGQRWRDDSAGLGGREAGLLAVARAPGGATWAVGWRAGHKGRLRPLVVRRSGAAWETVRAGPLGAGTAVLTDVAFQSAREGWAIGYLQPAQSSDSRPVLRRWDGRAWRREELPWAAGVQAVPRSLALSPDGTLWLAGTLLATATREARGFVAARRDGTWSMSVLGVPADFRSELLSVAAIAGGAMASGRVGGSAIVIRSCEVVEPAVARRRIAVSAIRQRRRVRVAHSADREPRLVPAPELGPAVRIAPPVAPEGFVVRDVSAEVGLEDTTETYYGLVADMNGDGWTDVFYTRHNVGLPRLALGGPQGFHDAPGGAFARADRHGCAVADVDGDGRKDLLCAKGRARGSNLDRHELTLHPATAGGHVVTDSLGITDPFGRGRRVAFMDLDGDGGPDVFITGVADREDLLPATNRFFRHRRGRYVHAPEVGLDRPVGGACLETVDIDGDGDDDLLHCQTHPRDGRRPGLRVHRNDGGVLRERSAALGLEPMGDIDALVVDVTGDGRGDLVQLSVDRLRVSRRTRTGFQRIYEARIGQGVAIAAGDASGDGHADLYVARGSSGGNRPDLLLVNDGTGRAFTSVRIPQAASGRADDVMALDHDRNGLTDFLVLDGRRGPGPVRLLAAFEEG